MITGLQIRSARAALRWSAAELARRAGVGVQTVKRLEQGDGVPAGRTAILHKVQRTLEDAGVEFIGSAGDSPGVRVRTSSPGE